MCFVNSRIGETKDNYALLIVNIRQTMYIEHVLLYLFELKQTVCNL